MSIIATLEDMLHKRLMTLTELSESIGLTLANLSVLKTGKTRAIRFTTLEAVPLLYARLLLHAAGRRSLVAKCRTLLVCLPAGDTHRLAHHSQ